MGITNPHPGLYLRSMIASYVQFSKLAVIGSLIGSCFVMNIHMIGSCFVMSVYLAITSSSPTLSSCARLCYYIPALLRALACEPPPATASRSSGASHGWWGQRPRWWSRRCELSPPSPAVPRWGVWWGRRRNGVDPHGSLALNRCCWKVQTGVKQGLNRMPFPPFHW